MTTEDRDRLDSWKEIAAFLDRDERTAMRWAAQQGMPVHRVPGGRRGRVFASRQEISQWLVRRPIQHAKAGMRSEGAKSDRSGLRRKYVAAGMLGTVALVLLGAFFYARRSQASTPLDVTRVTFTSQAALAWHGNRQLWKYEFQWPLLSKPWNPPTRLTDFVRIFNLNHGRKRVVILVAPLSLGPNPNNSYEDDVDCFSNGGKLLWSYVPHETFQFGLNMLSGPWRVMAVYVSHTGGEPSIWVAEDHHLWGNSFVVQLNAETGHAKLRFVNTGVLHSLNEVKTASGAYMLVGGFNNEYSSGVLAVINEKKPFAASPQTPGTDYQCVSCASGSPDEYFVFPRTTVNRVEREYEDPIRQISVYGGQIEVYAMELGVNRSVTAIYKFSATPTIHPVSVRYSTAYDMLYRELEKEGEIHQPLAKSPGRLHPLPVSVWKPRQGWGDYAIRPSGIAVSTPRWTATPPRYVLASAPRERR